MPVFALSLWQNIQNALNTLDNTQLVVVAIISGVGAILSGAYSSSHRDSGNGPAFIAVVAGFVCFVSILGIIL